jgi:hypothetical protein
MENFKRDPRYRLSLSARSGRRTLRLQLSVDFEIDGSNKWEVAHVSERRIKAVSIQPSKVLTIGQRSNMPICWLEVFC